MHRNYIITIIAVLVLAAMPVGMVKMGRAVAQTAPTAAEAPSAGPVPLVGLDSAATPASQATEAVPVVSVPSGEPMSVTGDALIDKIVGYLIALTSALVPVLITMITLSFQKRTGIKVDEDLRASFQSALNNGAGLLIQRLGKEAAAMTNLDTANPNVKDAIALVKAGAGEAIDHWKIPPNEVIKRLEAKIGIQTGMTDDLGIPLTAKFPAPIA